MFFKSLAVSDIKNIVHVQIQNLQSRLKDRNITLQWSDAALSKLADLCYVKEFGACPSQACDSAVCDEPACGYYAQGPDENSIYG